jgi:FkbM family methyltransferase
VVVFPVAAGETWSRESIFSERSNSGNTVLGSAVSEKCAWGQGVEPRACGNRLMYQSASSVPVAPLDGIFPEGFGAVGLVKMDVQGYECKALLGGRATFSKSPHVQAVFTEMSSRWLNSQCCAQLSLLHLLHHARPSWTVSCVNKWGTDGTCVGHPDTSQFSLRARQCCRATRNKSEQVLYFMREERRRMADLPSCRQSQDLALTDPQTLRRIHEQTRGLWHGPPLIKCDHAALQARTPPCDFSLRKARVFQLSHSLFEVT